MSRGESATSYYVAHTTVSIDVVAWAFPQHYGYAIECDSGGNPCPGDVAPDSNSSGLISVSGYFEGKNISLLAPAPFHLISTDPVLPVPVPAAGVDITVVLGLPSSPGEYSFTGNVTFV